MLCMVDHVDEYAVQQLKESEGNKFIGATNEGLQLDEYDDKKKQIKRTRRRLRVCVN